MESRITEKLKNNKRHLRLIDGVLPSTIEKENGHIVITASID
jgi:NADP-dependent 3-hydroxy acid dehydrogenase YdfG